MSDDLVKRLRSVSANSIYILGKPGTTQGNVIANEAADRIEELEAKLAKTVYKSAALVYSDMTEGERVACDFATYLTETPVMQLDFLSTFCLEVKQKQNPVGVVFYLGNTVVGYENLQSLGLRQTVRQGDTITIQPMAKGETDE